MGAHCRHLFSYETNWHALPPLLPGPIVLADVAISLPLEACTSKGLCVPHCCDSCQKLTWLSPSGMAPACLKQMDGLGTLTPSAAMGRGLSAVDTFSGDGVAVQSVQSIPATTWWPLKLTWVMFSAFWILCSLIMVCCLSLHSGLTVRAFDNLPCSLPLTGMVLSSQSPQLHLLLGHTPEEGSLVIDCGCPENIHPGQLRYGCHERDGRGAGLYRPILKI